MSLIKLKKPVKIHGPLHLQRDEASCTRIFCNLNTMKPSCLNYACPPPTPMSSSFLNLFPCTPVIISDPDSNSKPRPPCQVIKSSQATYENSNYANTPTSPSLPLSLSISFPPLSLSLPPPLSPNLQSSNSNLNRSSILYSMLYPTLLYSTLLYSTLLYSPRPPSLFL